MGEKGNGGSIRGHRAPFACAISLAAILVAGNGCGDDGTSASELKERLVPAEQVELEIEREFEWDNPTDFVIQGILVPEATPPSELIDVIDDAGFEAAAGEMLTTRDHGLSVHVSVAAFDSDDGATEARDALHAEDLKQPCFAACAVNPTEYEVDGVPNAVAVHHDPVEGKPPAGLHKFEGYLLEFTIGDDLYVVQASGGPGIPADRFDRGARAVYEYASAHD